MRLLFAMTVCSFCVVVWIAIALARRIRRSQIASKRPAQRGLPRRLDTQEFFEAGEFRTPRPLRLEQEIFQQRPRRALAEIAFAAEAPAQAVPYAVAAVQGSSGRRAAFDEAVPMQSAPAYASLFGQSVSITPIRHGGRPARPHETSVPEILSETDETATAEAAPVSLPLPFTLHRKPPQAARASGLRRRIDLSHFNKDMGDLTDPYTNQLRGSGTQGPVAADRAHR